MLCLINLNFLLACSDGLVFECSSSMSLSFGSIYQPLKLALLPESHVIRHLALEVLLTTGPPTSVLEAILKQCLKIEDTPLLVKNARIRQMHIRKLATMAQANGETASSTEVIDTTQRILIGKCIHRTYQILLFFSGEVYSSDISDIAFFSWGFLF